MNLDIDKMDSVFDKITLTLALMEGFRSVKMQALLDELDNTRFSKRDIFLMVLQAGTLEMIQYCEQNLKKEAYFSFPSVADVKGIFSQAEIENITYILNHPQFEIEEVAFLQAMRDACDYQRPDVVKMIFQHPLFKSSEKDNDIFFKYAIMNHGANNLESRLELVNYFIFDRKHPLNQELETWLNKKNFQPVIKMFKSRDLYATISEKLDDKPVQAKLKI